MNPKFRKYDKSGESKSSRQRKAAYKAWKTIRSNEREVSQRVSSIIDRYLSVREMSAIGHPEQLQTSKEEETSFARGVISLFHKTPSDIACGRFWEVRWAYGCPLDCNYCYLRGTMRGNMKPSPLRSEHVLKAIDEAFQRIKEPSIFNSGELSDSLMYPSLMEKIVDKFEEQNTHKILLLSKMGTKNIDFLIKKARKQTICAWSINAIEVAKQWERAAASPDDRIAAASKVSKIGYDTRVRIDPIFPIKEWKQHYEDIIYRILSEFEPKRIVLGTPRGLWKTIKYAREAEIDMSWSQFFKEDTGWGKKLAFEQRKEIYQFFFNKFKAIGYPLSRVTMCKETVQMWQESGLRYVPMTCNCYGKNALE